MDEIKIQENREKDSIRKYWFGYLAHNFVVKKLFALSSKRLQNRIVSLVVGTPRSILDTSCGDDDLIVRICRKFGASICIANDLSPQLTSFINDTGVILRRTNFNILSQPFVNKFDLVVCKNTLHHIPKDYQANLIGYLLKISRQLIIVDIENPKNSSIRARIWNWYYRIILGDKSDYFLDFEEFQSTLSSAGNQFTFGKFPTMKGDYMYGVTTKET
ncbi:MAG: class I SAM-dependent methyltransferase [Patescibacteria group bacterium]